MANSQPSPAKSSGQVCCEVCNVFVSSAGLLETHNKGKKHQQLVKLKEEQARASRVSLYVTGFKTSETSEDEMTEFFSDYGPVKKIYFDKNKGRFAIVEFEDESSVSAILEKKEPFLFKGKKLTIKRRTFSSQKSPRERKGEPEDINCKKRKKKHSETLSSLSDEILKKMNQVSTVPEQIDLLINEVKLTDEDLHLRSLICKILKEVFQEFAPSCDVVFFGSSANGLGCRGSDLDITLLIDTDMDTWNIDLDELLGGYKGDKESNTFKDIHSFVVKVLRTLVPGCSNIIPIFTAKCPVIKFTHQTTALSCDLTVNNRLGLQNTALLKCYMDLDPRVSQLVYTVRAWAKSIGVSGGGSGQLTSYALTVMVLHYLQATDPPVIPSLQDVSSWPLKEHKEINIEKELVDGWDCGFCKDISILAPSSNSQPVEKLLEEFFEFYSKFDYGNGAVSIKNATHCTISSLEDELENRARKLAVKDACGNEKGEETVSSSAWKTTPLCVQDPFELTHNLTQNVAAGSLKDIVQCMIDSRNICKKVLTEGYSNTTAKDKGIVKLFKYCPRTTSKRHKKDGYAFTVCLAKRSENSSTGGIVLSTFSSFKSFFESLCDYLEKELKISCIVNSDGQSKESFEAICTAKSNTWTHCRRERRKALRHEPSTSLETEEFTSIDVVAKDQTPSDENKDADDPCLQFRLVVNRDKARFKDTECEVKLEHLGRQGLQVFENFYAYFKKQVAIVFQ